MASYSTTVLADSPRGYWRLDEASGNFADSSGNSHTGTAGSGLAYSETGAILGNNAVRMFDDTNSFINVTDHADFDLGDTLSLECWLKPGTIEFAASIIDKGVGAYQLTLLTDYTFRLQARDGNILALSSRAVPLDGLWHHIVATKNGTDTFVYLDGLDTSTYPDSNQTLINTSTDLRIGATAVGTNRYVGGLDELAVYATALSSTRVRAHYNAAPLILAPYDPADHLLSSLFCSETLACAETLACTDEDGIQVFTPS